MRVRLDENFQLYLIGLCIARQLRCDGGDGGSIKGPDFPGNPARHQRLPVAGQRAVPDTEHRAVRRPGKGATTAAIAGATAAEVRGRQHENVYDQIDDDIKQDYRQNRARSAATAGAMIGASRQRQERRQDLKTSEQNITANNSVYTSCLQQRGYNVLP